MFALSPLPFEYNTLEPFIDETTMRLHHDKHHQTYIDKLNEIIKNNPDLENKSLEELLFEPRTKNMAGGVYNHDLFWKFLTPGYQVKIDNKDEFTKAALALFGSGWVWLTKDQKIISTANQDFPMTNPFDPIILCLDLWEHAYYLKYQNRRKDYIDAYLCLISTK